MDPAAQREFVKDHMDSDLQFILGDSGVSLLNQVAIARHYGTLRKFNALGDDRAAIRTACLQDLPSVLIALKAGHRLLQSFLLGRQRKSILQKNWN